MLAASFNSLSAPVKRCIVECKVNKRECCEVNERRCRERVCCIKGMCACVSR